MKLLCLHLFAHFECHYRLHGRTHKNRKSARQFRCRSKCIDKTFKCHTMAAIRSDNDNNKFNGVMECIDSMPSAIHHPLQTLAGSVNALHLHFTLCRARDSMENVFRAFFFSPFLAGFALMRMNKWTIVKPQIRSDVRLHSLRFSRWLSFACFCFHFEFHSYIRLDSPVQQHSHANFDAFDCRWC